MWLDHQGSCALQRNNLNSDGDLYKPNGTGGNLRWDTGLSQLPYSFERKNHKSNGFDNLQDFVVGIAGGGNELRSQWVFDNVNLPEVCKSL